MTSKSGTMQKWIDCKIRVTISDRRDLMGHFMSYDKFMNLIIADTVEYRRVGGKRKNKEEKTLKRNLGFLLLRGETIVSLSIEGPLLPEEQRNRQAPVFSQVGPGIAKASGRGIPLMTPTMQPGLSGSIKGLGGPTPGMMQPMNPKMPLPKMPPGMMPPGMMPPGMMPPGMPKLPPGMLPPKMPPGMMPPGMFPPGMPPKQ